MKITRFDQIKDIPTVEGTIKPLLLSDSVKVVLIKIPAGLVVPPHAHACPNSYLLLYGSVIVTTHESALLREGDLVHIPAGHPFGLESRSDAGILQISTPSENIHVHQPCITLNRIHS